LLAGSILALRLVPEPSTTWWREAGAGCGLLAILIAMSVYTRDTRFPGIAAVLPCIGAALVIWAGLGKQGRETWTGYLLGARIPVFIGLVSYSLYLWDWPLIVFAKHLTDGPLTASMQLSLLLATMLFAVLSWRYVEKPLRIGGWPWPTRSHRYLGAGLVLLMFVLLGTGLKLTHGLPRRIAPAALELASKGGDYSHLRSQCHADASAGWTFARTCVLGAAVPPKVILFADSHGVELSLALGEAAAGRNQSVRQITASGCPPSAGFISQERPDCAKYNEAMLRALSGVPPSTIIMVAYYFGWTLDDSNGSFWSGLATTIQSLRAAGHSVVLVGAIPTHPGVPIPIALAKWVQFGGTAEDYRFPLDRGAASDVETNLKRLANSSGATYVPLVPYLCPDERGCQAYKNGIVIYFDDNHLSVSGARQIVTDRLVSVIWK
jgi:hypothetical protein